MYSVVAYVVIVRCSNMLNLKVCDIDEEICFIFSGCDQRSVKSKQYFQWDLEAVKRFFFSFASQASQDCSQLNPIDRVKKNK